jgi:hypothetical protein
MRLLNATTYDLQEFLDRDSRPQYAILSHRWANKEIIYGTLNPSNLRNEDFKSQQLDKIRGTCRIARQNNLNWVWIDSCNINKESTVELNRSLNSMFQWYQEAAECYTYLSDVLALGQDASVFKQQGSEKISEWFERGWTLQELLAPKTMTFFDKHWVAIGTRSQLASQIESITDIEARFLDGSERFRAASIATKLSWAAHRKTTVEADMAYCLLGIFDVDLVPIPGEGRREFLRLQQRLIQKYNDESIFAWTTPPEGHLPNHDREWNQDQWGLLAPWVDCFQDSQDIVTSGNGIYRSPGDVGPTAEGVRFPMLLAERKWFHIAWAIGLAFVIPVVGIPVAVYQSTRPRYWSLTLNCWKRDHVGKLKPIQVYICHDSMDGDFWRRCQCDELAHKSGWLRRLDSRTKAITVVQPTGVYWPVDAEPFYG